MQGNPSNNYASGEFIAVISSFNVTATCVLNLKSFQSAKDNILKFSQKHNH